MGLLEVCFGGNLSPTTLSMKLNSMDPTNPRNNTSETHNSMVFKTKKDVIFFTCFCLINIL
jgi:hypothetical protein